MAGSSGAPHTRFTWCGDAAASGVSSRERVAHVIRRLSMGVHVDVVRTVDSTDGRDRCRARPLDSRSAAARVRRAGRLRRRAQRRRDRAAHRLVARADGERRTARRRASGVVLARPLRDEHRQGADPVPHVATAPHDPRSTRRATSRSCCTRSPAIPPMLLYLDGITNVAQERNENFGRECLELFTMGRDGGYTQNDVVEASRSFTGWVVNIPGRPFARALRGEPWTRGVPPAASRCRHQDTARQDRRVRHGRRARRDPRQPVDGAVRERRSCTASWSGSTPSRKTVDRLAKTFRRDYEIMPLVEAIARDDAFVSDEAVRAKYRTPVEKLVGIVAGDREQTRSFGVVGTAPARARATAAAVGDALRTMSFLPVPASERRWLPEGCAPARAAQPRAHLRPACRRSPTPPTGARVGRRAVRALRDPRRQRPVAQGRRRTSTTRRRGWRSSSPHRSTRSYEHRRTASAERPEAGITRRRFVTGLGVAAGAAVAAGYGLSVWANGDSSTTTTATTRARLTHARRARRPHARRGRARRWQRRALHPRADGRPRVSRACGRRSASPNAIALDDSVGLHPNLAKLAARYQAGQVAIVEGVGYPEPNLSHFASLAYWWARHAGGERQRRLARPLPRRHRGLRRPARRGRHRPGAVAGAARHQLVRDVDHRHHRSPAVGARLGRHARRSRSRHGRSSRPRRPIPRRCSGRCSRRSTSP